MFPSSYADPAKGNPIPLQIIAILGAGILAWSNSFSAPFVFDDLTSIVNNPLIRSLQRLLTDPALFCAAPRRFLGQLSFAANYRIGGLNQFGYHAVNLAIHLATALLLFMFLRLLLTGGVENKGRSTTAQPFSAPFSAALIFAVHPVQTQAVTYITQRFTLLATFFYLLALLCYAKSRTTGNSNSAPYNSWYSAAILATVGAMFSKEISFSIPFSIALLELTLFPGTIRKRLMLLVPFGALLAIPVLMLFAATDSELTTLTMLTKTGLPSTTYANYLITQPAVLCTYLRLLFLPINQTIDYDYQVYQAVTALPVLAGILLLTALIGLILYLYRQGTRSSRLAGFGMSWFLAALSAEALVPLSDVINEHRLYLPLAGASITASSALGWLALRLGTKAVNTTLLLLVLLLAAATWQRNLIWSDELLLWSDAVAKAPGKARPHYNLGTILSKRGLTEAAEQEFNAALAIEPGHARARYNLGVLRAAKGDVTSAMSDYQAAIRLDPGLAEAHNALGVLLSREGRSDEAIRSYREALRIAPELAEARNNLGSALAARGEIDAALQAFREAVRLDPLNRSYRANLERALKIRNNPVVNNF
ncbi:transmembrane and TPR repeat-containing protein F38B6.6 [Geobacter sp. OR-1]|uniref:tetratricopeptide repeat protein n=1 Tax=Geobacter sp. OR-1 TaxID=1266765 RepID=UPI0005423CEC|nr:tetratricopeptide repeat protein [Geobacter sp. OR-1]GAM09752.1 transmembrane and TPR repeat-containing protein F38B6.6 [Geobacter sp. OR-1]